MSFIYIGHHLWKYHHSWYKYIVCPGFLYVDIQLKGQIEHASKDPLPCSADPT